MTKDRVRSRNDGKWTFQYCAKVYLEPEEDDDLDKLRHLELKESEGSILLVRTGQGERSVK